MLARVIEANRRILHSVPRWIDDDAYGKSRSRYGCPERIRPLLDLPIDEEPTYTDLLVLAAQHMGQPSHYLEIGVSVGKNFYVMANVLQGAELVGFDWEAINPSLAERLDPVDTSGRPLRYRCRDNDVLYLQGDVLSQDDWQPLADKKFQLIFSDALHRGEALLYEHGRMRELGLIDEERFFLLWDDLDSDPEGPMSSAFWKIAEEMRRDPGVDESGIFQMRLNGWLGQHEHAHLVGVINNVGLGVDCLS